MFRKTLVALVASLALGAGIAPGVAAPRMMAGPAFGHGFAGGGMAFHGGRFGSGPRFFAQDGQRFHGQGFAMAPGRRFLFARNGAQFHRFDHRHFNDFGFFAFGAPFGYGAYDAYGYGSYYDPCWQPRRVRTPYGWHWTQVWACG